MMATTVGRIVLNTKRLDEIARNLNTNAEGALKSIAFQIEAIAKSLCPVDTGNLRNSIMAESLKPLHWWVHDGTEYGIYVEFPGITRRWAGHPFMTPAAEQVAKQIGAEFERELFK